MPDSKRMDMLVLSRDFDASGPIGKILLLFDALIMYGNAATAFGAQGQLRDMSNPFGPELELHEKDGRSISVRIPWQQIAGIVSGVERNSAADAKAFGFAPAKSG